jgi:hypothetical protein
MIFFRLILAWRRHIAASFFKKILPAIEQPTDETKTEEPLEKVDGDEDEIDDIDKDIEEQLLKLNEQQRKEAKRFLKNIKIFI